MASTMIRRTSRRRGSAAVRRKKRMRKLLKDREARRMPHTRRR